MIAVTDSLDAIVVLGSSLKYPEVLRARVSRAAALYREGAAPFVLATGGPNNEERIPESRVMRDLALEAGVPDHAVVTEEESLDTLGNARLSAPILRARSVRSAYLVTSDYHVHRSGIIFRTLIPEVRFRLVPVAHRFPPEELERRLESERRQLAELIALGFPVGTADGEP